MRDLGGILQCMYVCMCCVYIGNFHIFLLLNFFARVDEQKRMLLKADADLKVKSL